MEGEINTPLSKTSATTGSEKTCLCSGCRICIDPFGEGMYRRTIVERYVVRISIRIDPDDRARSREDAFEVYHLKLFVPGIASLGVKYDSIFYPTNRDMKMNILPIQQFDTWIINVRTWIGFGIEAGRHEVDGLTRGEWIVQFRRRPRKIHWLAMLISRLLDSSA